MDDEEEEEDIGNSPNLISNYPSLHLIEPTPISRPGTPRSDSDTLTTRTNIHTLLSIGNNSSSTISSYPSIKSPTRGDGEGPKRDAGERLAWLWVEGWRQRLSKAGDLVEGARWRSRDGGREWEIGKMGLGDLEGVTRFGG